jgi:hypothetical protein
MEKIRFVFALSACLLTASTSPISAQEAGILSLSSPGFTNGNFKLNAVGSPALSLQIQVSSNLLDWAPLVSIAPFNGSNSVVETNGPGPGTRFYRGLLFAPPATIQYIGNSLVLVGYVPAGYGPGAIVHFIGGGSGGSAFNDEVTADATGLYTFVLNTSLLSATANITMYVSSADGSVTSTVFSLATEREPGTNPALAVPANFALDEYGS